MKTIKQAAKEFSQSEQCKNKRPIERK